ncbi:MAG: hypothetical protein JO161_03265, partial [Planctomycetaceae bacterium]|nr:hypothetical protein [Planctomycetaceae bacterium]
MSNFAVRLAKVIVLSVLAVLVGWPLAATVIEAAGVPGRLAAGLTALGLTRGARTVQQTGALELEPATGNAIDPVATAPMLSPSAGLSRPARLAFETLRLVLLTEVIVLLPGVLLALLLFRTNVPGRGFLIALLGIAAFVPLPLHATAWLGA